MKTGRRRVAVLGGGPAALAAALALTEPAVADSFEVTVYQPGWRLGGKCASGRNLSRAGRIEEHGLHVWFGFYDNSFAMMHRVYAELGRPEGHPLGGVERAFIGCDDLVMSDTDDDGIHEFCVRFPRNEHVPGQIHPLPGFWQVALSLCGWALRHRRELRRAGAPQARRRRRRGDARARCAARLGAGARCEPRRASRALPDRAALPCPRRAVGPGGLAPLRARRSAAVLLHHARRLGRRAAGRGRRRRARQGLGLHQRQGSVRVAEGQRGQRAHRRRHAGGALADATGDLRPRLRLHRRRLEQADASAGTAAGTLLRLLFNHAGSILYKMQAGMGTRCSRRSTWRCASVGSSSVSSTPSPGWACRTTDRTVDEIEVVEQVKPAPGLTEYQPLVVAHEDDPKPWCWPSEPLWDQLQASPDTFPIPLSSLEQNGNPFDTQPRC